tara:strand:- start:1185 stop:1568 length:384 start_codon:yes stop_codon:yes gene_type:complete
MESLLEYQRWAKSAVDYSLIPNQSMVAGFKNYVEHGIAPGSFMTALLSNNLTASFDRADTTNLDLLTERSVDEDGHELKPAWIHWLWWNIPSPLWGSKEAVIEHCKKMATDASASEGEYSAHDIMWG